MPLLLLLLGVGRAHGRRMELDRLDRGGAQ